MDAYLFTEPAGAKPGGNRRAGIRLIAVLIALLLSACARFQPAYPPTWIQENAHSAGTAVTFNADGTRLASGGKEGWVRLWRVPDGAGAGGWRAHDGPVNGLAFVDAGLVTAGYDGTLAYWRLDGQLLRRPPAGAPVLTMAVDPHQGFVLTGHDDGSARLWRLPDFALAGQWRLHHGRLRAVAISGNGRQFASAGADGQVFLWRETAGPAPLPAPPTDAWSLTFAPDGRRLFGGGWFRLFRWELPAGTLTVLATEHTGVLKALRMTPDGRRLASISRHTDSLVAFLDPDTGVTLQRFQRHRLCGADVAVSADGRYLAATSDDASVRLWNLHRLAPAGLR